MSSTPGNLHVGYPLPQSDLKSPREGFSIFVDNFDQTLVVAESEAGVYMVPRRRRNTS